MVFAPVFIIGIGTGVLIYVAHAPKALVLLGVLLVVVVPVVAYVWPFPLTLLPLRHVRRGLVYALVYFARKHIAASGS